MQVKTIQKNVTVKLEEWLNTIEDKDLAKLVKAKLVLSGGSITSMFLNETVNDYDIYLMDIDVCKRLAEYYTKPFTDIIIFDGRDRQTLINDYNHKFEFMTNDNVSHPIELNNSYAISLRNLKENQIKLYFEGANAGKKVNDSVPVEDLFYTPLYFSPNAISLSNNIQIVLRFNGSPEEIHKTFDFIHATNYFTFGEGLVRNLNAIESILTKQLNYQGSHYPLTSIIRAKKFVKRGFNIGAGEYLKIMFQISQLDLTNPDILEEQLIGVDVAYFDLIITALRNKMESDKNFKLSSEYMNALIDKVFNSSEDIN